MKNTPTSVRCPYCGVSHPYAEMWRTGKPERYACRICVERLAKNEPAAVLPTNKRPMMGACPDCEAIRAAVRSACGMTSNHLPSDITSLIRCLRAAQCNARILAHAWKTDNRPPANVVEDSLAYPITTKEAAR